MQKIKIYTVEIENYFESDCVYVECQSCHKLHHFTYLLRSSHCQFCKNEITTKDLCYFIDKDNQVKKMFFPEIYMNKDLKQLCLF